MLRGLQAVSLGSPHSAAVLQPCHRTAAAFPHHPGWQPAALHWCHPPTTLPRPRAAGPGSVAWRLVEWREGSGGRGEAHLLNPDSGVVYAPHGSSPAWPQPVGVLVNSQLQVRPHACV